MSLENDPTQQGGQLTGRMAAIAQIAERNDAATAHQYADISDDGELVPREEAEEVQAEQPRDEQGKFEAEEKPEPVTAQEVTKPRMVSIVVDGQTLEVEESRIIEAGKRTLQKESAADRRLQEAAAKERRAQALFEQAQRLSPDAASQPEPSQDVPQQYAPATRELDPQALDQLLENKLYMRDANKALEAFKKEFPDIVSDRYLATLAANLEDERLRTATALGEPFGDPFEAYRKHGETIRAWRGVKPQATTQDKQERKRTITAVPSANATPPSRTEPKPLTVAEQIAQQKAMREKGMGRPQQRI